MDSLRKKARILMWLVTIPFVLLFLLAAMQVWFVSTGSGSGWPFLIAFAPMFIYIWAIWMVRQALKNIADGSAFDLVLPRLLTRVGLALFFGALFHVFASPIAGAVFDLRLPLSFDGAAVTLGVVGATLVLLSQLLKQAASIREELDSIL
jgi:hypothetical protein